MGASDLSENQTPPDTEASTCRNGKSGMAMMAKIGPQSAVWHLKMSECTMMKRRSGSKLSSTRQCCILLPCPCQASTDPQAWDGRAASGKELSCKIMLTVCCVWLCGPLLLLLKDTDPEPNEIAMLKKNLKKNVKKMLEQ